MMRRDPRKYLFCITAGAGLASAVPGILLMGANWYRWVYFGDSVVLIDRAFLPFAIGVLMCCVSAGIYAAFNLEH